jgi:CHAD domain-containing protein
MLRSEAQTDWIAADPWRETLVERIEIARAGRDREGVHGLRVACARLDVFLRFVGWRALRDDLRWLRRAASNVRDFDVLLERELPAPFRAHLEAAREPAQRAFAQVLDHERCAALLEALEHAPPSTRKQARLATAELRARLVKRGERAERAKGAQGAQGAVDELHALRRALRRLRYAYEWLGSDSKPVRKLQDELGALNDAVIALRYLDESQAHRGAEEYRARLEGEVAQRARTSLEAWTGSRKAILEEPV